MATPPFLVDTLIPLDSLDGSVWNTGFRGEILYYPIEDYDILPDDVLKNLVDKILERLKNNKKVGIFCLGGHGRTGYVASVVLGKMGVEDPIGFLRTKYCKHAVETQNQLNQIAEILNKPKLVKKYEGTVDSIDIMKWLRYDLYDDFR